MAEEVAVEAAEMQREAAAIGQEEAVDTTAAGSAAPAILTPMVMTSRGTMTKDGASNRCGIRIKAVTIRTTIRPNGIQTHNNGSSHRTTRATNSPLQLNGPRGLVAILHKNTGYLLVLLCHHPADLRTTRGTNHQWTHQQQQRHYHQPVPN